MMLQLSRRTVRQSWPPYVGAFVALACGIVLIATAVTMGGAVDATARSAQVSAEDKQQLDGLATLIGIMATVALFMAVFVVASTFGFVVAARRRELAMLRLVGATPRQVRRLVLGEAAVVALLASVAGALLATAAAPAFAALLHARGVVSVDLQMPAPWRAWAVAAPCGAVVALLGSWRASKRASRVPPAAALRESGVERRRPSVWQLLIGTTCLAGPVALLAATDRITPLFSLIVAILLPEVAVVGLICFGGVVFPLLAALLARPFVGRDAAARLARDHVRAGVRTPAALAAPILAISAIAGSMIVALSFTADWTTAMDRAQLYAPLVVETGGDARVIERLKAAPGVALVDPRTTLDVRLGADGSVEPVEVVHPAAMARSRGLRAVHGSLARLDRDTVAVTETYASDAGAGVGDHVRLRLPGRTVRAEVAAVVPDAPDLYADVLVPRELAGAAVADRVADEVFVDPGTADVQALLAGTSAQVLTAEDWIDAADARTRASNELGLWVLLGPSGLYAAIAIVNAVLIGVAQRRAQLRTIALLGATPRQLRRMALWEAGLVGAAAVLVGGAITAFVGRLVRTAITGDVPRAHLTIPWVPLAAILLTCLGLALLAALVGSARVVRRG